MLAALPVSQAESQGVLLASSSVSLIRTALPADESEDDAADDDDEEDVDAAEEQTDTDGADEGDKGDIAGSSLLTGSDCNEVEDAEGTANVSGDAALREADSTLVSAGRSCRSTFCTLSGASAGLEHITGASGDLVLSCRGLD